MDISKIIGGMFDDITPNTPAIIPPNKNNKPQKYRILGKFDDDEAFILFEDIDIDDAFIFKFSSDDDSYIEFMDKTGKKFKIFAAY